MIKTGGENVASREVEEMVYRLPAVSEVAVVGLPGSALDRGGDRHHRGQGGRRSWTRRQSSRTARARWRTSRCRKRVIFVDSLPEKPQRQVAQARIARALLSAARRWTRRSRRTLPGRTGTGAGSLGGPARHPATPLILKGAWSLSRDFSAQARAPGCLDLLPDWQ